MKSITVHDVPRSANAQRTYVVVDGMREKRLYITCTYSMAGYVYVLGPGAFPSFETCIQIDGRFMFDTLNELVDALRVQHDVADRRGEGIRVE